MALRSVNPIKRFLNIAGLLSGLGLGPVHPALGVGTPPGVAVGRSPLGLVVASGIGDAIAVTGLPSSTSASSILDSNLRRILSRRSRVRRSQADV